MTDRMSSNSLNISDESSKEPTASNMENEETSAKKEGDKKSKVTAKKQKKGGDSEGMSKSKLRKLLRNTGQGYVTKTGKQIAAKVFNNKDCGCSKRCKDKIALEDRQKCFDKFWKMGDFGKQNAYLSGLVTREAVKQHRPRQNCTNRGPKGVTYQYRVNVGRVSKQVCKKYFLHTFLVSDGRLSRALRKEENEKEPGEDLRGKKPPANKTSEENLQRVHNHIGGFQKYDAHYSASLKGKFLAPDLNVKKMYNLYVEDCKAKQVSFVKENIYRSVFNDKYSLTFLSPRRDPCHISQPKPPSRKKAAAPKKAELKLPAPPKFPPQIFAMDNVVKCGYNHMAPPPPQSHHTLMQEKNAHFYQCNDVLPHDYFSNQEHHTTYAASQQTPSFLNL